MFVETHSSIGLYTVKQYKVRCAIWLVAKKKPKEVLI
jgi:hypothetical protein